MITLTMKCSRCSKEVSSDMTNTTLNDNLVRKFGFNHVHDGKANLLICDQCEKLLKELQDKLTKQLGIDMYSFFQNCEGEKENEDKREPKNG